MMSPGRGEPSNPFRSNPHCYKIIVHALNCSFSLFFHQRRMQTFSLLGQGQEVIHFRIIYSTHTGRDFGGWVLFDWLLNIRIDRDVMRGVVFPEIGRKGRADENSSLWRDNWLFPGWHCSLTMNDCPRRHFKNKNKKTRRKITPIKSSLLFERWVNWKVWNFFFIIFQTQIKNDEGEIKYGNSHKYLRDNHRLEYINDLRESI